MIRESAIPDFSTVTEMLGVPVSVEQLEMNYHRYRMVSPYCERRDVLELGCGAGQGLGYLAIKARRVVGGDITETVLRSAQSHYNGRIPLVRLDAQVLPFRAGSFDVVIIFETIYYLPDHDEFIEEVSRVLRKDGVLAICTVNKEWPNFNPSPFSTKYLSAKELRDLFMEHGFSVDCYAAFRIPSPSLKNKALSFLKRGAVSLGLIPKTMKGKGLLKRVFIGKLYPLGEVIEGMANYIPPVPISDGIVVMDYKIIYAIGIKKG